MSVNSAHTRAELQFFTDIGTIAKLCERIAKALESISDNTQELVDEGKIDETAQRAWEDHHDTAPKA